MDTSLLKASVVVWPNLVTAYIMSIIASYLTDVWGLSITRAAAIVNVYSVAKGILPVGLISIVYLTGVRGSYRMILLSRFAYTTGLVLLTISTPPILSWAIGTCSSSKAECIGQGQKALFYTALPLIVVGVSTYYASMLTFLDVLLMKRRAEQSLPISDRQLLPTESDKPMSPTESAQQLQPTESDSDQPMPPTAFDQPLPPSASDRSLPDEPLPPLPPSASDRSLPDEPLPPLPPSASDRSLPYEPLPPSESDQTGMPSESDAQRPRSSTSPNSDGTDGGSHGKRNKLARFFTSEWFFGVVIMILFPAAAQLSIGYIKPWSIKFGIGATFTVVSTIIFLSGLSSYPRGPQTQPIALTKMFRIRDTKSLLTLMATCMTCILTGVVISIGNTYFIEQATNLNHHLGKLLVPVIIFPNFIQKLPKLYCVWEIKWLAYVPARGIASSLVLATLCCITAAKVESRRLGVVERDGFSDDPTSIISMSMFSLVPQFLLLGLAEEVSQKSVINIFRVNLALKTTEDDPDAEEMKESKSMYLEMFAQAVSGVGILCGVLSVYVVGLASEKVGGTSWFQHTLNRSRLDNYYWTLAALTATNLVLHFLGWCLL